MRRHHKSFRVLLLSSNAPMSQPAPCGRLIPRWSVAGHVAAPLAALTAGLVGSNAWV